MQPPPIANSVSFVFSRRSLLSARAALPRVAPVANEIGTKPKHYARPTPFSMTVQNRAMTKARQK
jgi:hypothetical protein